MVRKQLYIRKAQEAALKERAQRDGVSEAELMRQALDGLLAPEAHALPEANRFLEDALVGAAQLAQAHALPPEHARWTRDSLYEERETRWVTSAKASPSWGSSPAFLSAAEPRERYDEGHQTTEASD